MHSSHKPILPTSLIRRETTVEVETSSRNTFRQILCLLAQLVDLPPDCGMSHIYNASQCVELKSSESLHDV
jgi:hypothetical protein